MQRKKQLSPKQQNEWEGREKHIWHQKLKQLEMLRWEELEEPIDEQSNEKGIDPRR